MVEAASQILITPATLGKRRMIWSRALPSLREQMIERWNMITFICLKLIFQFVYPTPPTPRHRQSSYPQEDFSTNHQRTPQPSFKPGWQAALHSSTRVPQPVTRGYQYPSTPEPILEPTFPAPPPMRSFSNYLPPVAKYEFPSFLKELQTQRVPPPPPVRRDQPAPSHFLQTQDVNLATRGKLASLV